MKNETKQNVLITGGTSGIGLELAKIFASEGYNLLIAARNPQELDRAAQTLRALGAEVETYSKDLFDKEQAFALCEEIGKSGKQVDVLVNDAGQGIYGLFKDTDLQKELDIISLNVSSLVILTKHFLKEMVNRGEGRILNVASIAGKIPGPWQSVYHGTKAFVLSFTEAITEENKDSGVSITALLPGVTDTDFFNKAGMNESKAVQDKDKMADPAKVARDGYDALMAGKTKVISGIGNKLQVGMSNLTPDNMVAKQVAEQQKPVDK